VAPKTPTQSSGRPSGGILLVEEYSALGVAITSALRKFAPLHEVRIAHSLAEAEKTAEAMRPELLLLDLDPPPSGEIAFFSRLKAQYPEARVLVIAPGTSRELRTARGTAGAIQFVQKPFDLAEFGAAVQALLGPWVPPHSTQLRGTLRDLHLIDLVQLKCLALCSTVIHIEADEGGSGAIYFRRGQICHAVAGVLTGAAAFEEIASWSDGHFSETDLAANVPTTINLPWPVLLLPIARRLAEEKKTESLDPAPPPGSAPAQPGKKILVVDDTEMLLIFVADTLATADQTWQIITASTGAEGIQLAVTERPDLILLDYSLTDVTGDRVCHALLEDAATARIPILMMSGHLSELARTAHDYRNVLASLPKPFLSGTLISEVERVLAEGPLPKAPRAPSAPVFPSKSPKAPLPNGRGGDEPLAVPPGAEEPLIPATSELRGKTATEPAKSEATVEQPPAPASPPTTVTLLPPASFVRPMEASVTLALEVVSMQLTSSLKMEAAKLQPCNPVVLVKMGKRSEFNGVPVENGFRLGTIRLSGDGTVDTMRLIPTHQPPQLPAAKNSFAIGRISLERTNSHQNLQCTAPKDEAMRVLLTMECDFLAIELSAAFEVDALMLKARHATVFVRNGLGSSGARFALEGAELSPSAELRALLVRAVA
jgi:DNA-binding response OmpR family regulator